MAHRMSVSLSVCLKIFWATWACIGTNLAFIFLRPGVVMGARGSSVGFTARDGIYGPGIESRWQRDLPYPSRPLLGPTHPIV